MKTVLFTLVLISLAFTAASAQNVSQISGAGSSTITVSFYDGDPSHGAELLSTVTPFGTLVTQAIEDAEKARYIVVHHGDESYTLKVYPGGVNQFTVLLDIPGVPQDRAMTLQQFMTVLRTKS